MNFGVAVRGEMPSAKRVAATSALMIAILAAIVFAASACSRPDSVSRYLTAMEEAENRGNCSKDKFRLSDTLYRHEPEYFVLVCGEYLRVWKTKEIWRKRGFRKDWSLLAQNPRDFPLAEIAIDFTAKRKDRTDSRETWLPSLALSHKEQKWEWDFPGGDADRSEMGYLVGMLSKICQARHGNGYLAKSWQGFFASDMADAYRYLSECRQPDVLGVPPAAARVYIHAHCGHTHHEGGIPHEHIVIGASVCPEMLKP